MKDTHFFLGFTLTELLAVIIIISILSGLSVGYYKRSVEQSRFSEGLAAAGAVVEALNRAYLDEQFEGGSAPGEGKVHSFKTLDVSVGDNCASENCQTTPNFVVYITTNSNQEVVRAYRGSDKNGPYYIEMYPNYDSNKDKITCVGNNNSEEGKTFCQSMGYVSCSGYVCTK